MNRITWSFRPTPFGCFEASRTRKPIAVILRRPRAIRRTLQQAPACAGLEGWRPVRLRWGRRASRLARPKEAGRAPQHDGETYVRAADSNRGGTVQPILNAPLLRLGLARPFRRNGRVEACLALTQSEPARPWLTLAWRRLSARMTARLAARLGGSELMLIQRLAGTVFLIRVVSALLAYGSQVLFARWMGGFEFGIYVYVWTWVLLIGQALDLGLATAAQRFIPEYREHKH